MVVDPEFVRNDDFDRDNDSLYVMPLQIVPFATPGLRRGKLIKNVVLKPAIEVFQYDDGASAQILIEDVTSLSGQSLFGWKRDDPCPDLSILHKLGALTSYDVFSLRILFRDLNISIASIDYLTLSDDMKAQLDSQMKVFTQPLVKRIYGDLDDENLSAKNIIKLFNNPDSEATLQNLQNLAQILGLEVQGIPSFLEDFADLYLSFAYYQKYLDDIVPKVVEMVAEIKNLQDNNQMNQDRNLMNNCLELVTNLNDLLASTTGRFEKFYNDTDEMWDNISTEKFRDTETLIKSYHTAIGGVLCGLGIKMNAWKKRFPSPQSGGPYARAEYLLNSVRPGMEKIMAINQGAPLHPDMSFLSLAD